MGARRSRQALLVVLVAAGLVMLTGAVHPRVRSGAHNPNGAADRGQQTLGPATGQPRFRRANGALLDAGARLLAALLGGFKFSFPSFSLPEPLEEEEEKPKAGPEAEAANEDSPDAAPEDDAAKADDKAADSEAAKADDTAAADAATDSAAGGADAAGGSGLSLPDLPEGAAAEPDEEHPACAGEGDSKVCAATPEEAADLASAAATTSASSDVVALAGNTGSSGGAGATAAALVSGAGMGAVDRAAKLDEDKREGRAPSIAERASAASEGSTAGAGAGAGADKGAANAGAGGGAGASADKGAGGEAGAGADADAEGNAGATTGDESTADGEAAGSDQDEDSAGAGSDNSGASGEHDGSAAAEGAAGDKGDGKGSSADGDAAGSGDGATQTEEAAAMEEAEARGPPVAAIQSLAVQVSDDFDRAEAGLQAAVANITAEWGAEVDRADDRAIRLCARARSVGPRIAEAEKFRRQLLAAARSQSSAALAADDAAQSASMLVAAEESAANASKAHALAVGLAANRSAMDTACQAAVNASRVARVGAMRRVHSSVVAAMVRMREAERRVVLAERALERHQSGTGTKKQIEAYTRLVEAEKRFVSLLEELREDFQATFDKWNATFARPVSSKLLGAGGPTAEEEAFDAVDSVTQREESGSIEQAVESQLDELRADGGTLARVRAAAIASGGMSAPVDAADEAASETETAEDLSVAPEAAAADAEREDEEEEEEEAPAATLE